MPGIAKKWLFWPNFLFFRLTSFLNRFQKFQLIWALWRKDFFQTQLEKKFWDLTHPIGQQPEVFPLKTQNWRESNGMSLAAVVMRPKLFNEKTTLLARAENKTSFTENCSRFTSKSCPKLHLEISPWDMKIEFNFFVREMYFANLAATSQLSLLYRVWIFPDSIVDKLGLNGKYKGERQRRQCTFWAIKHIDR